eukprot:Gregarina_sp_Pseudo_9__2675@NODE_2922_length_822_cov_11_337165_g2668_i0_p1_GENE_NODE_2922_length_822_cov_11_337165_g2668_i0NODE_2922_length_822_cov_11_337165_g2668_i0_p1_ORF_typecomplete_len166_score34_49CBM_20/PF00686_19/5_9e03CBM_20/PF00686_19/2_7e26CBM_48/PF02922_18/0_0074_NODE_2922_length_822_cov_11_337165_g2668_i0254751
MHAFGESPRDNNSWQDEEKNRERLRIRAKYAQRNHERKVEVYFKALELVRQRELQQSDGGENSKRKVVSFLVNFATYFGQELYIIGNTSELGEWIPEKAVKMTWSEGNNWRCDVPFQSNQTIQYKYLVKDDHGNINWEWGLNHELNLAKNKRHLCADKWGGGQQS